MAKAKITGKLALQLLEEVVAEKGADYLYPDRLCAYVKAGQPSCLVGHAFAAAGLSIEQVALADNYGSIDSEFQADGFPLVLTPKAVRVLGAAQCAQDGSSPDWSQSVPRKTWGEALEEARRVK